MGVFFCFFVFCVFFCFILFCFVVIFLFVLQILVFVFFICFPFLFCFFFFFFCFFFLFVLDICGFDFCGFCFCRFVIIYVFFCVFFVFRFVFVFCCIFCCFFVFDSMCDFSFAISIFERELFDLFGLFFVGNDILSRILSDWCCFLFVLCKDFPLYGFFLFYYDLFGFDCRIYYFFLPFSYVFFVCCFVFSRFI